MMKVKPGKAFAQTVCRVSAWRRKAIGLAAVGAISLCAFGAAPNTYAAEKEPIKVGLLLTYVGPTAIFAREQDRGARLLIDEVNSSGGIDGRKIEVVRYDTEGKP